MAGNVRLKHTILGEGERTLYFYDGELPVKDGVVSVPKDKPEWIRRAWVLGYRLDAKGNEVRLEELTPEAFEVGE